MINIFCQSMAQADCFTKDVPYAGHAFPFFTHNLVQVAGNYLARFTSNSFWCRQKLTKIQDSSPDKSPISVTTPLKSCHRALRGFFPGGFTSTKTYRSRLPLIVVKLPLINESGLEIHTRKNSEMGHLWGKEFLSLEQNCDRLLFSNTRTHSHRPPRGVRCSLHYALPDFSCEISHSAASHSTMAESKKGMTLTFIRVEAKRDTDGW